MIELFISKNKFNFFNKKSDIRTALIWTCLLVIFLFIWCLLVRYLFLSITKLNYLFFLSINIKMEKYMIDTFVYLYIIIMVILIIFVIISIYDTYCDNLMLKRISRSLTDLKCELIKNKINRK